MINTIKKLKKKEDFNPGLTGLFINPFFIARRGLYRNLKKMAPFLSGSILDAGCGRKPYKDLFTFSEYIGMDIENPGHSHKDEDIDVFYDGTHFPFAEERFDHVLCNQVIEHVFEPDAFLKEINRTMKTGGNLLLSIPFVWDEHEQPYDYARYSSFGIRYLLEKNGFEIVHHIKSVNSIAVVFQLLNVYIYKKTLTKSGAVNLLTTLVLISPFNILGTLLGMILPDNNDLYLDHIILAKKVQHG